MVGFFYIKMYMIFYFLLFYPAVAAYAIRNIITVSVSLVFIIARRSTCIIAVAEYLRLTHSSVLRAQSTASEIGCSRLALNLLLSSCRLHGATAASQNQMHVHPHNLGHGLHWHWKQNEHIRNTYSLLYRQKAALYTILISWKNRSLLPILVHWCHCLQLSIQMPICLDCYTDGHLGM